MLERLLGFDLKLRQYELGKRFCDGVVSRAGIEGLNRVWDSPGGAPVAGRAGRARLPGSVAPRRPLPPESHRVACRAVTIPPGRVTYMCSVV